MVDFKKLTREARARDRARHDAGPLFDSRQGKLTEDGAVRADQVVTEADVRGRWADDPRPNSPEDLGVHQGCPHGNPPGSARDCACKTKDKPAPTYRRNQEARKGSLLLRARIGPDEEFEKIAEQLTGACDKVKCSIDEYQSGLRFIIGELEICLQASKEMGPQ